MKQVVKIQRPFNAAEELLVYDERRKLQVQLRHPALFKRLKDAERYKVFMMASRDGRTWLLEPDGEFLKDPGW